MQAHAQLLERMRQFHESYDFFVCAVNQTVPFDAALDWHDIAGVPMEHCRVDEVDLGQRSPRPSALRCLLVSPTTACRSAFSWWAAPCPIGRWVTARARLRSEHARRLAPAPRALTRARSTESPGL